MPNRNLSGILRAVPPQSTKRTYGPPRKSESLSPPPRRHGAWRGQRALRRLAVHRRQRLTRGPIARRASGRDESADQPESFPLRAAGDGKTMANLLRRLNPTRAFNGLWRHGDFLRLWSSLTITHFGGQITFLALPLTAALLLDATPLEMGVLTALEALPFALFGLFAGVLVDRVPKLPIIVWSDIARALALLAVPLCAWLGVLSMGVLYTVGFLVGLGTVCGWPAYQVFMTERVGRGNLVEANAKIGVSDSAAQLVGPGIAGALIQWLTAPFAILLDALSFLLSAWILRGIRSGPNDAPKMRASSIGAEIREGLSAIWRNAVLRALAWAISVWQIFRHASLAIVVLYAA